MSKEIKFCPNCGSEQVRVEIRGAGSKLVCLECNMVYEVKADGSARVIDTDPIGKIRDGIKADILKELKPAAATPLADPYPDDPEIIDDDGEDDGFISW